MADLLHEQKVLILDFGSQYTQNIARKVRECQVYCEIQPCTMTLKAISEFKPKGIILSGGPASVLDSGSPICDPKLFGLGIPVLGICYGMQLITHLLGGKVNPSDQREFGRAELMRKEFSHLFEDIKSNTTVWMSHGDTIKNLPNNDYFVFDQITKSLVGRSSGKGYFLGDIVSARIKDVDVSLQRIDLDIAR